MPVFTSPMDVFLPGSALMFMQLTSVALVGGAIGTGVGQLICRHAILAQAMARSLRMGMWIPVLLLWVVPVATPWGGGWHDALIAVLLITISAVAMATIRDYVIARSVLDLQGRDVPRFVCRNLLLQALFVGVFSQPMLSPYGWQWFSVGGGRALAATILICLALFAIERVFRSSFEERGAGRAGILLTELSQDSWSLIKGAGVFVLFVLCIWQLLAISGFYKIVSSPIGVLAAAYTRFLKNDIWIDMYISNFEIFFGMVLAVGIGIVCDWMLVKFGALRGFLLAVLPLTFITPIMAVSIWVAWFHQSDLWQKVVGIASLSAFPFILAFWGLRDRPFAMRILMGVYDALPFAFVGMLFGESMASTSGLGFSIVKASAQTQGRSEAIALVFVTIVLMAIFSAPLRWLAKRRYFWADTQPRVALNPCSVFTRCTPSDTAYPVMLKLRNYIKLYIVFFLILLASSFIYIKAKLTTYDTEVKTKTAEIKDLYGVDIHYQYTPESFFPKEYSTPPASAKGSQISLRHARNLLPIIEQFLSTYPRELVKKNLSDIYLVGKLEFYGKSYGGTYIGSAIYIRTKGTLIWYDDWSLLGTIHSEFSSILFRNYKFPIEQWEAVNPPGWKYEGTGFEMLGRSDLHKLDEQLFHNGFLENYSQSSLENDFNMFVDWAFARPSYLRELSLKYERIRKKYQLVLEFYQSVDPAITIPKLGGIPGT